MRRVRGHGKWSSLPTFYRTLCAQALVQRKSTETLVLAHTYFFNKRCSAQCVISKILLFMDSNLINVLENWREIVSGFA